ncbi:uncharacterized protein G2W53_004051 [Senna tora]|uniref:Uncharacterized protein n=1 Tax=Senna tora TaxID=362788 RepID=A0A834XEJ1_9FABA|nr:uncharacterized protein G2W53_004051 [Senna tora]
MLQRRSFCASISSASMFYVGDHSDENRYFVMKTVPRDLFNMGEQLDDCQDFHWGKPYDSSSNPALPTDDGEVDVVRRDVPAIVIDQPLPTLYDQSQDIDYEENSDSDDSDEDYMDKENEQGSIFKEKGLAHGKNGGSPIKRSGFDVPLQAKSSSDLLRQFK